MIRNKTKAAVLRLEKEEFAKVKSYEEIYIALLKSLGRQPNKEAVRFVP
jgi:hypothetical protein